MVGMATKMKMEYLKDAFAVVGVVAVFIGAVLITIFLIIAAVS